jgi:hypothetical protein
MTALVIRRITRPIVHCDVKPANALVPPVKSPVQLERERARRIRNEVRGEMRKFGVVP